MTSITIPDKVRKIACLTKLKVQKHSPEILIVVGVAGTIAGTVMACLATTKVSEILEDANTQLANVHACQENPDLADRYNEDDAKKDTVIIYTQASVKLVKLYAPAVVLSGVSIACIVASNQLLRKRNVALAAAYATIDKGYKEYRNRVVDRFGKDVEREIRHNIKATKIEETIVDEETGKEKKVKNTISVAGQPHEYSDYARFFDESCDAWKKNAEYNLIFLKAEQAHANNRLIANGVLFLNEVYEMLGIQKTKEGQIIGWYYDEKDPTLQNHVDFGIYDYHREANRKFVNGYERVILLDFNVDGDVYSRM